MHGHYMDATTWFYPSVFGLTAEDHELPLPLRLVNEGYDVWLGNMRGTQYSRGHETLDSTDIYSGYWNFSWKEKSTLDFPAAISAIKEETGGKNVAYIGAS